MGIKRSLKSGLLPLFFALVLLSTACSEKESSALTEIISFESKFLGERNIQLYLPAGYNENDRYSVLYMHDGQMLFDSTTTWNGQEWGVDEVMDELIESGEIPAAIVVGVWNDDEDRHIEYFPQKPFELLNPDVQDSLLALERSPGQFLFSSTIKSDTYLKFLVEEVMPWVEQNYRTSGANYIGGSSMGGLISWYALCEYPEVFSGAFCMSTHWPGIFSVENNPIPEVFGEYLTKNLPDADTHSIYFDFGTETLDAWYEPLQLHIDSVLIARGFSSSNWITKKFEGHAHDEKAWNSRLHEPLKFLLKAK